MTLRKGRTLSKKQSELAYRIARYLLVFFLPIVTGIIFYKQLGVYPFGERSILSVDLWTQYYPMFREFARADSLAEKMYSWSGALGFNHFVQSAFYCRSLFLIPFSWLSVSQSIIYIDTVSLIRLGLSALTCLLFLEYKFKKHSPLLTALSVSYGLCAYGIAFIMQFMWTDLMIYAPLILLGLEKLFEGRSPLLYMLALGLCIYTNFYVAFGTCIFTAFYFAAETVKRAQVDPSAKLRHRITNARPLARTVGRFVLASGAAGAANAVLLIPTLLGLSHTGSASRSEVDFTKWYHTMSETANALLPRTQTSLEYGVPNIAVGLFMFLFIPLYFLHREIKLRDKIATGVLLGLLYAGMNFNPLDYVFNGFHFANQLPGRWTFLVSLALVVIAAEVLMKPNGLLPSTVVGSCVVGVALLGFTKYSELTDLKKEHLTGWMLALVAVSVLMLVGIGCRKALKKRAELGLDDKPQEAAEAPEAVAPMPEHTAQAMSYEACEEAALDAMEHDIEVRPEHSLASIKKTAAAKWTALKPKLLRVGAVGTTVVLTLCILADACVNTVKVATGERGVRTSNLTHYLHATSVFDTFGPMYDSGEDTFYRVENNQGWTFNDGLLGGYKGVTYYGSTMNGEVYKLLRALGNRVYTLNISTIYNPSSPVQNGVLGIRYFIDKGKSLSQRMEGLQQTAEYEDCIVWENPTALPLAFAVNDRIREFPVIAGDEALHALATQNTLINAMLGNDLNIFEHQPSHWEQVDGVAEYVFTCTSDQPIYVEQNFGYGSMEIKAGDRVFKLDAGAELFKYLGRFAPGTEIRIRTDKADPTAEGKDMQFYVFNEQKWVSAYAQLAANGLQVTSFKANKVTGTVSMANDGLLLTTIPQDGGWSVYVDGKKADSEVVCNTLLAVRLGGGEHEVTFRYRVPGIVLGAVISLLAVAFALFLLWWCRKRSIDAPAVKKAAKTAPKKRRVPAKQASVKTAKAPVSRPDATPSVWSVDEEFFDTEPEE